MSLDKLIDIDLLEHYNDKIDSIYMKKPKSGLDGQIVTYNNSTYTNENPIQLLNMVNTQEELDNALSSTPLTLSDVFDDWYRFAHNPQYVQNDTSVANIQTALDAFYFNESTMAIGNTVNTVPYVGFISEKSYKNWYIKTSGKGTDGDDDFQTIIVGFMTDKNGIEHTLSVVRGGGKTNGYVQNYLGEDTARYPFALVYDLQCPRDFGGYVLTGLNTTQVTGSLWSAGCKLSVERNGNTIIAKTSQFGSDNMNLSFTYTLPETQGDLTAEQFNNIRIMLNGASRIGFGMLSQPGYFILEETQGIFDNTDIYDVINNKVYKYNNGWKESGTVEENVINMSRVYNEKTNKLFYYKNNEVIVLNKTTISSSTSGGESGYIAGNGIDIANNVISLGNLVDDSFNIINTKSDGTLQGIKATISDGTDFWRLVGGQTERDKGFVELSTADNGDSPIYVKQYQFVRDSNGVADYYASEVRKATLLDENGNTSFPNTVTMKDFEIDITDSEIESIIKG